MDKLIVKAQSFRPAAMVFLDDIFQSPPRVGKPIRNLKNILKENENFIRFEVQQKMKHILYGQHAFQYPTARHFFKGR